LNSQKIDYFPASNLDLEKCLPVYETLQGWDEDISQIKQWNELPLNARTYVERIEQLVGAPINLVSVGPDRNQTIIRKPITIFND
jgi:adenylosuccinate synthase